MAYIIKNTSGLINTRITDVGRRNISQGNFNISYFQIGDSEVSYNSAANYNQTNNNILMPAYNAQNDTGSPQSNKQNIKYPYYLQGSQGNTYGIPYMDSGISEVYNSAGDKGFFVPGGSQGNWQAQISSAYTVTSNYWVDLSTLDISYVSSLSWYFLCSFGLNGVYKIILGQGTEIDDGQMQMMQMQMQMGGANAMGFDASAAYKQEIEQLSIAKHEWSADRAERSLLGDKYPDKNKASVDLSRMKKKSSLM
jgi:hypothetical protein